VNSARKLALVLVSLLGVAPAALAQSAYTTGTITDSIAAGYPSPYGPPSDFYNYAPGFRARSGGRHHTHARSTLARRHDHVLYGMVQSDPLDAGPRVGTRNRR
jgi:hypothetical protein